MSALSIGGIVFLCCFAAALLGMLLHVAVPDHHLDDASKDVVKLVMGIDRDNGCAGSRPC